MQVTAYVTVTLAVGLEFDQPITGTAALERATMDNFINHPALQNPEEALWAGVDRIEYEVTP